MFHEKKIVSRETFLYKEVNFVSYQTDFINSIKDKAIEGQKTFGVYASVTIAQACWESGYGRANTKCVKEDNNLFGIKWTGRYAEGITVTQGSKVGDGAGYYNHYESQADSVYDHGWFLRNNSRYAEHGVFDATNGKEQLKCIMDAGYAESEYYNGACAIIDMYSLEQYDTGQGGTGQDVTGQKIENAVKWMIDIANDDSHGYDQEYRWGERGDYDCSSLVISGYTQAGIDLKGNGATYTGNMKKVCLSLGFKEISVSNWNDTSQFKRGDIILNEQHHVCCYIGDGQIVQASINENGETTGGKSGDQNGKEILVRDYYIYSHGWDCVLRLGNGASSSGSSSGGSGGNKEEVWKVIQKTCYNIKQLTEDEIAEIKKLEFNGKCKIRYTFNRNKKQVGTNYFGKKLTINEKEYIINNVRNDGFVILSQHGSGYYNYVNPKYLIEV